MLEKRNRILDSFGPALLVHLTTGGCAFGTVLRLTIRDQVDAFAVFFYATPWPVLAALSVVPAAWWSWRKRWAAAALCTAAGCGMVTLWFAQSWVRNSPGGERVAFRLFLWNAEHPKRRLSEVLEVVRQEQADIIAITETESTSPEDRARWAASFPGYAIHNLAGGMLVITRGETVGVKREGRLARGSRYHLLRLRLQNRSITLLFVDFSAAPLRSRRPAFESLSQILRENASDEIILVGDFNTPRESVHFDELRKTLRHAFETRGNGYAETWPVPLPVLSLDHVWTTPGLQIVRSALGWAPVSDHRPVVVDFGY